MVWLVRASQVGGCLQPSGGSFAYVVDDEKKNPCPTRNRKVNWPGLEMARTMFRLDPDVRVWMLCEHL